MASSADHHGRRRPRWLVATAVVLALAGLVTLLAEPLRVRTVAATTVADALGLPVIRPAAAEVERREATVGGVEGALYETADDAPAVVLLPGAAPEGIDDPRIVELAEALARAHRTVFLPELEVYGQDLVTADVERIVAATRALSGEPRGPAVLVGTSFGGSLGLLAAADPRLAGRISLVATFGAYADLLGVLQAATTGHGRVDGRDIPWPAPHPRAGEIVGEQLASLLEPEPAAELEALLDGSLARADAGSAARAAHDLLTNDDPARTDQLARRLPEDVRQRLAEVSPTTVADDIEAPVVAMHSRRDPAIPYAELVRLGQVLPQAQLITLERFDHVELEPDGPGELLEALGDLRRVWRFATEVLATRTPRGDGRPVTFVGKSLPR